MQATVHPIDGVPGPQDNSWVDAVLTALRAHAVPAGALVARPMGLGPGYVAALWGDGDEPGTAGFAAGPVTVGPALAYRVDGHRAGTSAGPARYLQLTTFSGHDEDWCAAYDRAAEERIWPAVKDVPGLVGLLSGAVPGARMVLTMTDSADALEAGAAAILSSTLLDWEKPEHMTGPDGLAILRLVHADVPAGTVR